MTENIKRGLRKKAQTEIQRLDELFENEDVTQKIDTLKDKFSVCEIVYKIILKDYLKSKNEDTNELDINMTQVKPALRYAGYIPKKSENCLVLRKLSVLVRSKKYGTN